MIGTKTRIGSGAATARSRGVAAPAPGLRGLEPSARLLVAVALVPVAVLGVHEIRYLLAFGDSTGAELAARGHGYLGQVLPPLALICALALGGFLAKLGVAWQTGSGERSAGRTLLGLWVVAAAGLLGIHAAQELLEALISLGQAPSPEVVFGDGGLWAVPASLLVGLVLALLLRGATRVVELIARLRRPERRPRAALAILGRPQRDRAPRLDPMALSAPGRAPPRLPVPHLSGV